MKFGHFRVPKTITPLVGFHDTQLGIRVYYVAWLGHQICAARS